MNFLKVYGDNIGLSLNMLGAILIGAGQGRLFFIIRAWLTSLDFTIETLLNPKGPIIRPEGWDQHMDRATNRNNWLSSIGWILMVLGFLMQLIPHFVPN